MNKFVYGILSLLVIFSLSINANASTNAEIANQNLFLAFVIDESGSMANSRDDTIGSFNSLINEHKQMKDGVNVFVVTNFFNTSDRFVHEATYIKEVEDITKNDYRPGGGTALLDAIGNTVSYLDELVELNPNSSVMLVIITDGQENSSREYKKETIKNLLEEREKLGWTLQFYGAGVEAYDDAKNLGFTQDNSVCFKSTSENPSVVREMADMARMRSMECRRECIANREVRLSKENEKQQQSSENKKIIIEKLKNKNPENKKQQNQSVENKIMVKSDKSVKSNNKILKQEGKNENPENKKQQNKSVENKIQNKIICPLKSKDKMPN